MERLLYPGGSHRVLFCFKASQGRCCPSQENCRWEISSDRGVPRNPLEKVSALDICDTLQCQVKIEPVKKSLFCPLFLVLPCASTLEALVWGSTVIGMKEEMDEGRSQPHSLPFPHCKFPGWVRPELGEGRRLEIGDRLKLWYIRLD